MRNLFLGSIALAALIAGPVMAADMPLKAPPPVAVFSWTGCYVGIEGGGAWGRSRHDAVAAAPISGIQPNWTPWFDVSGGLAGVEYGCNQQFGGNWVFGIESDISWTNKKGSSNETGALGVFAGTAAAGFSDETREKWISTSRARIGWTWDRAMFFVTGGFAAAKVDASVTIPAAAGFGPGLSGISTDSHTVYGWTVGAGLEYAFLNNWSLKAEYLYARFENQAYLFNGTPAGILGFTRGGLNLDNHIVRAGLNWRFTECVFFSCSGPIVAKY
jgi:outer membrane immunogenic protein